MTLHKYFCMAPVLSHHCPTPYSSTAFRLALPASTSRHYNLHFLHSVEPISFICTPSLLSSFCRGVGGYDGSGHRAFSSSLSIISSFTWTCIPFKKNMTMGGCLHSRNPPWHLNTAFSISPKFLSQLFGLGLMRLFGSRTRRSLNAVKREEPGTQGSGTALAWWRRGPSNPHPVRHASSSRDMTGGVSFDGIIPRGSQPTFRLSPNFLSQLFGPGFLA